MDAASILQALTAASSAIAQITNSGVQLRDVFQNKEDLAQAKASLATIQASGAYLDKQFDDALAQAEGHFIPLEDDFAAQGVAITGGGD